MPTCPVHAHCVLSTPPWALYPSTVSCPLYPSTVSCPRPLCPVHAPLCPVHTPLFPVHAPLCPVHAPCFLSPPPVSCPRPLCPVQAPKSSLLFLPSMYQAQQPDWATMTPWACCSFLYLHSCAHAVISGCFLLYLELPLLAHPFHSCEWWFSTHSLVVLAALLTHLPANTCSDSSLQALSSWALKCTWFLASLQRCKFLKSRVWVLFISILWPAFAAATAKSLQSCPTLCDPVDGGLQGFPVPGILQARTLEWAAISFSNAWKWKVKVNSLSRVRLLATPWTAAYQAPPSMGFSRQEYWSGVPLPSPLLAGV